VTAGVLRWREVQDFNFSGDTVMQRPVFLKDWQKENMIHGEAERSRAPEVCGVRESGWGDEAAIEAKGRENFKPIGCCFKE
jgi:hypothetical protein